VGGPASGCPAASTIPSPARKAPLSSTLFADTVSMYPPRHCHPVSLPSASHYLLIVYQCTPPPLPPRPGIIHIHISMVILPNITPLGLVSAPDTEPDRV